MQVNQASAREKSQKSVLKQFEIKWHDRQRANIVSFTSGTNNPQIPPKTKELERRFKVMVPSIGRPTTDKPKQDFQTVEWINAGVSIEKNSRQTRDNTEISLNQNLTDIGPSTPQQHNQLKVSDYETSDMISLAGGSLANNAQEGKTFISNDSPPCKTGRQKLQPLQSYNMGQIKRPIKREISVKPIRREISGKSPDYFDSQTFQELQSNRTQMITFTPHSNLRSTNSSQIRPQRKIVARTPASLKMVMHIPGWNQRLQSSQTPQFDSQVEIEPKNVQKIQLNDISGKQIEILNNLNSERDKILQLRQYSSLMGNPIEDSQGGGSSVQKHEPNSSIFKQLNNQSTQMPFQFIKVSDKKSDVFNKINLGGNLRSERAEYLERITKQTEDSNQSLQVNAQLISPNYRSPTTRLKNSSATQISKQFSQRLHPLTPEQLKQKFMRDKAAMRDYTHGLQQSKQALRLNQLNHNNSLIRQHAIQSFEYKILKTPIKADATRLRTFSTIGSEDLSQDNKLTFATQQTNQSSVDLKSSQKQSEVVGDGSPKYRKMAMTKQTKLFPKITGIDPMSGAPKMGLKDFYNFLVMHGEDEKAAKVAEQLEDDDQPGDRTQIKKSKIYKGMSLKEKKAFVKSLCDFLQGNINEREQKLQEKLEMKRRNGQRILKFGEHAIYENLDDYQDLADRGNDAFLCILDREVQYKKSRESEKSVLLQRLIVVARQFGEEQFAQEMESLCQKTSQKAQIMQNMIFGLFEEYIDDKDQFPEFKEILDEENQQFKQFSKGHQKFKGAVERVIQKLPVQEHSQMNLRVQLSLYKLQTLLDEIFVHKQTSIDDGSLLVTEFTLQDLLEKLDNSTFELPEDTYEQRIQDMEKSWAKAEERRKKKELLKLRLQLNESADCDSVSSPTVYSPTVVEQSQSQIKLLDMGASSKDTQVRGGDGLIQQFHVVNQNPNITLNMTKIQTSRANLEVDGSLSLADALSPKVEGLQYYELAKAGYTTEDNNSKEDLFVKHHFEMQEGKVISVPTFVQIRNKKLFLCDQRLSSLQIKTLSTFLTQVGEIYNQLLHEDQDSDLYKHYLLEEITMDNCRTKDEDLAAILTAVLSQKKLKSLVLVKGEVGKKSVEVLKRMLDHSESGVFLRSFKVAQVSGLGNREKGQMLEVLSQSKTLMEVKISGVNLNRGADVEILQDLIERSLVLTHLDLSWASLSCEHLKSIIESLAVSAERIRHLDLSYNSLNRYDSPEDQMPFVKGLLEFIKKAKSLTHLLISGMELLEDPILQICEAVAESQTIMSAHLSDMGILNELADEVLDIFQIEHSHLKNLGADSKPQIDQSFGEIISQEFKNINDSMKNDSINRKSMIDFKNYLAKGAIRKDLGYTSAQTAAAVNQGVGRFKETPLGSFVLNRKLNMPELCFNQNLSNQDSKFESNASGKWQLVNDQIGCFMCQKHKQVIILFDANDTSKFKEVKNPHFAEFMRRKLQIKASSKDSDQNKCYVFGTVTHGWHRKVEMLEAGVFSLLTMINKKQFVKSLKKGKQIQNEITSLLDSQNLHNHEEIFKLNHKLKGWDQVFKEKFLDAEPKQDIHFQNIPVNLGTKEFRMQHLDRSNKKQYIYSEFLPAGHHQFFIYESKSDKFFAQDFFVEQRNQPYILKQLEIEEVPKTYPNVWKSWVADSPPTLGAMFGRDTSREVTSNKSKYKGQKFFQPFRILKDEADLEMVTQKLKENYKWILGNFQLIQATSSVYPECDFQSVWDYFEKIQRDAKIQGGFPPKPQDSDFESEEELPQKKEVPERQEATEEGTEHEDQQDEGHEVEEAEFTSAFIRAKRFDRQRGIRGALNRAEFMDLVVRIIYTRYWEDTMTTSEFRVAPFVDQFMRTYFEQTFTNSELFLMRTSIRHSKTLNALLHDNRAFLKGVWRRVSDKRNGFTEESAQQLFLPAFTERYKKQKQDLKAAGVKGQDPPGAEASLRRLFVYSKITVKDEVRDGWQYNQLKYVEFLELVCRVAIDLDEQYQEQKIQYCVYDFLCKMLEAETALKAKLKKQQGKKPKKDEPEEEISIIPVDKDIEQEQADHELFAQRLMQSQ